MTVKCAIMRGLMSDIGKKFTYYQKILVYNHGIIKCLWFPSCYNRHDGTAQAERASTNMRTQASVLRR